MTNPPNNQPDTLPTSTEAARVVSGGVTVRELIARLQQIDRLDAEIVISIPYTDYDGRSCGVATGIEDVSCTNAFGAPVSINGIEVIK